MRSGADSNFLRRSPAGVDVPQGEIRVVESHHAAGFRMALGTWPFHKFCWVATGRGRLEFPGGTTTLQRDDFLIIPEGWAHRFVDAPASPLTLVILCISEDFFAANSNPEIARLWRAALQAHPPGCVLCARTAFLHTALVETIRRALREQSARQTGWQTGVQNAATALLLRMARGQLVPREGHGAGSLQAVADAVDYVNTHPHEPLQVAEMAERCRLSPRRFSDLFRQCAGEPFNSHLVRRRIEFAKDRLRKTGHILYACHESGFNDPAYFYRVFKKITGMTPGAFVKKTAGSGSRRETKRSGQRG